MVALACLALVGGIIFAAQAARIYWRDKGSQRAIASLESHWGIPFPHGAAEVSEYRVEANIDPMHRLTTVEVTDPNLLRGTFFDPATLEYGPLTSEQRALIHDVRLAAHKPEAFLSGEHQVKKEIRKPYPYNVSNILLVVYDPVGSRFFLFERRWDV